MNASLITIGDEILSGRTQDTNASFLGKALFDIGIQLTKIEIVPDNTNILKETLHKHIQGNDFVFTSGGLGPTLDDLTKKSVAEAMNLNIKESSKALSIATKHYQRTGKKFNKKTSYHLIPETSVPVHNSCGYAPGLIIPIKKINKFILCAPGVPSEFKTMLKEEFVPFILSKKQVIQKCNDLQ